MPNGKYGRVTGWGGINPVPPTQLQIFFDIYTYISFFIVPLPNIYKTYILKDMMFNERIKQLREYFQLPQRKLAGEMDIDTSFCYKMKKGEQRASKEHIPIIAELLQADYNELLALWFAVQATAVVEEDKKND